MLRPERILDFGKAFYATIDISQARNFVNLRYPGIGAILKFNVNQSTLSNLQILSFAGVTQEWQEAVWAGRNGLFDIPPMPFDVVFGPYLTNIGTITPSGTSVVNAKGRGDQQAWTTGRAITVLQMTRPVLLPN